MMVLTFLSVVCPYTTEFFYQLQYLVGIVVYDDAAIRMPFPFGEVIYTYVYSGSGRRLSRLYQVIYASVWATGDSHSAQHA